MFQVVTSGEKVSALSSNLTHSAKRAANCQITDWMNFAIHDLMPRYETDGTLMTRLTTALLFFCALTALPFSSHAELQDQGLNSVIVIIDKAISVINNEELKADDENAESASISIEQAITKVVNMSNVLGSLSFSRLQCKETDVLSEFTLRVQQIQQQEIQNAMREAFDEGFEKSSKNTALMSEDECARLTLSRKITKTLAEPDTDEEQKKPQVEEKVVEQELPPEEPKLRHLRIAELSGQLAYKRKVCDGDKVFTRDYNAFFKSVPEEYLQQVKAIYWKGYQHGKRLNLNLTSDDC